jgi:colicin import membrane protein
MKYLETKHEKKSAQVTALVTLILVLLLFFVTSPPYTDPPEEYGVAINFGNPSQVEDNIPEDLPSSPQDSNADDTAENSELEEVIEEEVLQEEVIEEINEKAEADLLAQEAENVIKIKEAKEKANKEAKEQNEAKQKAEADAIAKAKSDKEAKDKAEADAKAAADRAAKAKAAKAAANKVAEGGNSNQIVSFSKVERVPVYSGCTGSNDALKKCMSDKINTFISDNFDKELPGNVGLSGIQTILIVFKINEQGKVVGINVRANHPKLVTEAKRVANMLPRFKPGMQNGKPVTVPFSQTLKIQTGK